VDGAKLAGLDIPPSGAKGLRRGSLGYKLSRLRPGEHVTVRVGQRRYAYRAARRAGVRVATRMWGRTRLRVYRLPEEGVSR